jgi:helix-turn-helix protein
MDQEDQSGGDDKASRAAQRAVRRDARIKKKGPRTKEDGSERPTRLCSLGTIEVRKDSQGYQIIVRGGENRRSINVAASEVSAMMKDLEAAIYVIRAEAGR